MKVIDWSPGLKHDLATDVLVSCRLISTCTSVAMLTRAQFQILGSTAGKSVRAAVEASGEPPIHQLADLFKGAESKSLPTSQFWDLCAWREQFQRQYHDYWRSTRKLTASKRAVDGVIMPVAPHTAAPEGSFKYYGTLNDDYSCQINFLTFSSILCSTQRTRLHDRGGARDLC